MSEQFDFSSLIQQAQALQEQLLDAQQKAAETEVVGTAGGGMVKAKFNGAGQALALEINQSVVDPDEVEMLQDLVLAAIHDAHTQIAHLGQQEMPDLSGLTGLGGGLEGLGLPGLGS